MSMIFDGVGSGGVLNGNEIINAEKGLIYARQCATCIRVETENLLSSLRRECAGGFEIANIKSSSST